jgi:prolyl oligopeptidase
MWIMKVTSLISFLTLISILDIALYAQQPPKAPSQPVTETFFGKQITDRFRNLENLNDSVVMNWYKEQAAFTEKQFNKIPIRDTILSELKELDSKFKYTVKLMPYVVPTYRGNYTFYVRADGEDQSEKLYVRRTGSNTNILLFDPNKNNTSGHLNVISGLSINDDGSKASVVIVQQGLEVGRLLIIDTKSGKQIDSIARVVGPASWIGANEFMYVQYHSSNVLDKRFRLNREAKTHLVGTNGANDPVVLSHENNPEIVIDSTLYPEVSAPHKNAKYLVALLRSISQFNDFYVSKFDSKQADSLKWYPLIKKQDRIMHYFIQRDKAFGLSVKDNKKGKILMTSVENPDWDHAKLMAEATRGTISSLNPMALTNDYLYYVESYGVEQTLYRIRLADLKKEEIKLPLTGTIIPWSTSTVESQLKILLLSWVSPTVIYDFDEKKMAITKPGFWLTPQVKGLDNLEIELAYAVSYDGTKVPLTIIKPKGVNKDGSHKVIINGYGNYGAIIPPLFDPWVVVMGRHDVILAIAHVRGGGEFGEAWRLGGFKSTKPNTWKDAIACAEYMVKEGYTQPSKMAIMGTSAGGILAGRAMTERPDLFAVAIPRVGILNTLRFEFTPNGAGHIPEFGTIKNDGDFNNIYKMDSYMNIKDSVNYPATLVTGALNDTRVILWQPGKFAARLQQVTASGKPVWFRIDMHGGHGVAETKDQNLRHSADILAFLLWQTSEKKGE